MLPTCQAVVHRPSSVCLTAASVPQFRNGRIASCEYALPNAPLLIGCSPSLHLPQAALGSIPRGGSQEDCDFIRLFRIKTMQTTNIKNAARRFFIQRVVGGFR